MNITIFLLIALYLCAVYIGFTICYFSAMKNKESKKEPIRIKSQPPDGNNTDEENNIKQQKKAKQISTDLEMLNSFNGTIPEEE